MLEDFGENVEVRNYLKEPLSFEEIEHLLKLLKAEPLDIIRKKESVFKENYANKTLSRKQWIEAMVEHPILIERPIVVKGKRAIIGRPPELIKELLAD